MPSSGPLISIVMGVYNGEKYLEVQVSSVLAQTHDELELIISEDGSSDESLKIADRFASKDARVRVIRSTHNKGLVANFLEALAHAKGDLIAFSDQDDVWQPDKLEVLRGLLEKNPENQLAYSDMEVCDEGLKRMGPSFWKAAGYRPKEGHLAERAVLRNLAPGCSMLFRRETKEAVLELVRHPDFKVRNAARLLDNTPFMHDHLVFVAASALGRIVFTPATLSRYRQHGANNVGAFYEANPQKNKAADILKGQIEILETAEWARRGLDLRRLRRFHAAMENGSVFGKIAFLPDYLYLRA